MMKINQQQFKTTVIISSLLAVLFIVYCLDISLITAEEEVRVEKEGQSTTPLPDHDQSGKYSSSSNPQLNIKTEKSKKLSRKKSKKNIWKKLMKGLNQGYQNDWFDNQWFQSSPFSNFDESFNSMRRRMNNMMRRSNMLPSLFDDHQWWEDYTNSFNSMNNNAQKSISSSSSSSSESSSMSETSTDKPLRRRGPISSVIRTINQDGKNELSLDINNIPRDVFEKKDIEVKIKENSLGDLITISAEKKTENGHFQFSKSFRFPKGSLDLDKVKATLSDEGTLSVKIPRIDEPEIKERVKEISIE
ncbi:predicted protein [Naegleria gruberi]|uniref:Predicted protein n=1 Tax=Naegleria gruberi TaxID=5762 RepID=D2W5K4_NAEGR|nr:uncharacterized protein NAEGRDRAFT_76695 [Naegleria gruberi]EFC35647.1 predicted protein [Naegleria gruberi]|eukprot:XP_002668391.1 predicted protein [Naegleria gruberi strain NEG-M]